MPTITRLKSGYPQGILHPIFDRTNHARSRYVIAIAAVGGAYAVSQTFGRVLGLEIYIFPFLSILIAGFIGGLGPGLLATVLASLASYRLSPLLGAAGSWLLITEGTLVSVAGGYLRKEGIMAREQFEKNLKLEQQILEISEDERRQIGNDLHDGLGQHLTGISLLSETMTQQLMHGETPESTKAETITQLTAEAIGITQNLARSLSPMTLEREGFGPAIAELAETSSTVLGINCVCESKLRDIRLEKSRALHLFRIVQEAVNNSVRHGKAKNVRIELLEGESALKVIITDDGIGLSTQTSIRPGLGLRIMQYRAQILSATLTVTRTAPSGGTTVICTCSL